MKKRLQIILLLWGCILMQVVLAFPHRHTDAPHLHHHAGTSRQTNVPQGCSSECITRFYLAMPSERPALHKATQVEAHTGWMIWSFNRCLFLSDTERPDCYGSTHPFFYASPPPGGTGLRAPPCPYSI